MKKVIKLKLSKSPTPTPMLVPTPVPVSELFTSAISPYVAKVIEKLQQTQLKPELVEIVELAIRHKAQTETRVLFLDGSFDAYRTIYNNHARHIIENLKESNEIANKHLIEQVNQGLITPSVLVNLTPQEMFAERWQPLIEKKVSADKKLIEDPEATSTLFWCGKCHRNKTRYFERQDRGADEPKTNHITCCYCGHKWRQ